VREEEAEWEDDFFFFSLLFSTTSLCEDFLARLSLLDTLSPSLSEAEEEEEAVGEGGELDTIVLWVIMEAVNWTSFISILASTFDESCFVEVVFLAVGLKEGRNEEKSREKQKMRVQGKEKGGVCVCVCAVEERG